MLRRMVRKESAVIPVSEMSSLVTELLAAESAYAIIFMPSSPILFDRRLSYLRLFILKRNSLIR